MSLSEQRIEKTLFIIPARGGSKRLVGKNIKQLNGLPLIAHSIEYAKKFTAIENICISTDNDDIIRVSENFGVKIPFVRPEHLATDSANSEDVIFHALNYYKELGKDYKFVVLLQPTSPFRKKEHLMSAYDMLADEVDAVISVVKKKANYYTVLKREYDGCLGDLVEEGMRPFDKGVQLYEINGSIYLMKIDSLRLYGSIPKMKCIKKVEMPYHYSVDIDTIEDWKMCEYIIKNRLLEEE